MHHQNFMEFVQKLIRSSSPSTQTVCLTDIMILAQAVLQLFCSQGPLWVKWLNLKWGIIQPNIDRILWKVNQVINIMYPNCMPDIMILAQEGLHIFCSQGCFTMQNNKMPKSEKGDNSVKYYRIFPKVKQASTPTPKIQSVSQIS